MHEIVTDKFLEWTRRFVEGDQLLLTARTRNPSKLHIHFASMRITVSQRDDFDFNLKRAAKSLSTNDEARHGDQIRMFIHDLSGRTVR